MRRIILIAAALLSAAASASWQSRAESYQRDLIREARIIYGINAPIAMLAGQIHQESLWHPAAQSPYANGLTQFTPDTEAWIKTVYPDVLSDSNAFDPQWAIRAMVRYDNWLYQRIRAVDDCNRWAMVLAAYNGGLGWINRDKRLATKNGADALRWWDNVERYSTRSRAAFRENRAYPAKIIYQHQRQYLLWGGVTVCLD